jgi:hypothetical protein
VDPGATPDSEQTPPEMPTVDVSKLNRYPTLFVDSGQLRHALGWQRWAGIHGGACFAVCKLSDLAGIKVVERFPLTQDGWAEAWASLLKRDAASAQAILNILARESSSGVVLAPPPPPRFPSTAETRRNILNAIATGHEKYARPFDRGKIALASFVGTESWSDYGNVVLQMAILDTLLSIEEKLSNLLAGQDDRAPG